MDVTLHVDESTRSEATEETWETGSNARLATKQRRTPYEWQSNGRGLAGQLNYERSEGLAEGLGVE
jgi:hypothetical protein